KTHELKYKGEPTYLEIGEGNVFREFSTVHRGTGPGENTIIGNGNLFLAYAHVAHNCIVGNKTIFSNNATLAGHVTVGDYAIISGLRAVHQFCRIRSAAAAPKWCRASRLFSSPTVIPPIFAASTTSASNGVASSSLTSRRS